MIIPLTRPNKYEPTLVYTTPREANEDLKALLLEGIDASVVVYDIDDFDGITYYAIREKLSYGYNYI
jgi:hypothetical protein